jgi:hypothetical protein
MNTNLDNTHNAYFDSDNFCLSISVTKMTAMNQGFAKKIELTHLSMTRTMRLGMCV